MIMLSHGRRCYPTEENIYDFYSRGIIGVIVHGHVIRLCYLMDESVIPQMRIYMIFIAVG